MCTQKIPAALAALLVACILSATPLQAQRAGISVGGGRASSGISGPRGSGGAGISVGGGRPSGGASGARVSGGARMGGGFRGGGRFHGGHNRGGDVFVAPFWYDDWGGGYDEPYGYGYERPEPPVQTVFMPPPPPEPVRIPSDPKVVELPGTATAPSPRKLPPAVFILTNGQRIETQHYLLTSDRVQLTADRQLRTIPLTEIDLKATLAADHERGIDLRVPSGGGEVSLGF